jgi:hypothetical protein
MYLYPWDVWDEGIDACIDTLQRCGIDAVQLAVRYHIASYLLPRNPVRVLYHGDHGALYFQPSGPLAGVDAPVSPTVRQAGAAGSPPDLSATLQRLGEAGLGRVAWVIYAYDHALARARPDLAVEHLFGDRNAAQLCAASTAFGAYARALTDEILNRLPVDGLLAESLALLPHDYGMLNLKRAFQPSPAARTLLGVCWCPDCRRAAAAVGIDVAGLRAAAASWLRRHLAELPDAHASALPSDALNREPFGTDLAAYRDVAAARVTATHRAVLERVRAAHARAGSTTVEALADPRATGVERSATAELIDDARIFVDAGRSAAELRAAGEALAEALPRLSGVAGLLQLDQFERESEFRAALDAALSAGLRSFRFYNYGLLSDRQLGWLEAAQGAWR